MKKIISYLAFAWALFGVAWADSPASPVAAPREALQQVFGSSGLVEGPDGDGRYTVKLQNDINGTFDLNDHIIHPANDKDATSNAPSSVVRGCR